MSTQPIESVHSNADGASVAGASVAGASVAGAGVGVPPQAASAMLATTSRESKASKRLVISYSSENVGETLPETSGSTIGQTMLFLLVCTTSFREDSCRPLIYVKAGERVQFDWSFSRLIDESLLSVTLKTG
jgi:hypothetical protein